MPGMDELIQRFKSQEDGDLTLCLERGVAYQADMSIRAPTGVNAAGVDYFDHYAAIEGGEIAEKINAGRVDLVNKYVGTSTSVLDTGIGSGEFIRRRANTFGRDVNQKAVEWLKGEGKFAADASRFIAFTYWDVLEHIDAPNEHFKRMPEGSHLFTCLPIFADLRFLRSSRHYKPGEHLYYWTERGFVDWMELYRFRLLERATFETEAGRDSIVSFAFKRDLPGYHDTLAQYQEMHSRAYGTSAYLFFDTIAKEVLALNPKSILDFGCGRSDLVAHFWKDGARRIEKYDPAIPQFKLMPKGQVDLALCTDVMEHIPMTDVDRVLGEIREAAHDVLFTISMKPARAKLPDGRNAHVTLLNADEWMAWIRSVFGTATRIPAQWDHILMVKTF